MHVRLRKIRDSPAPTGEFARDDEFGVAVHLGLEHAPGVPCRHSAEGGRCCIEANAPGSFRFYDLRRDKCPASAPIDEPARSPEARVAGKHNGLITMLDADLVVDPGDMVAISLLREPQRRGDL